MCFSRIFACRLSVFLFSIIPHPPNFCQVASRDVKLISWCVLWYFMIVHERDTAPLPIVSIQVFSCSSYGHFNEEERRTKNVCGQAKMEKNSVIKVTLHCVRHRRTVQPISQESLAIFPALVVVSGKTRIENRGSIFKSPYLFYYFLNRKRDNSGTKGTKKWGIIENRNTLKRQPKIREKHMTCNWP